MKILILSASDIKGGAAKVAWILAGALKDRGHEVAMHVTHKASDASFVHTLPPHPVDYKKLGRRLVHRLGIDELNLDLALPKSLGAGFFQSFDLVHLHDLPRGFNLASLPWLCRQVPVVWTLHSMWPLTGGCLYPYECDRWRSACGQCPQFGQWPLDWLHRDGSRLHLFLKRRIYVRSRLTPVCVSNWLADQARAGALGNRPVTAILNPVDLDAYCPMPKDKAKEQLGIDPSRRTILFALASNIRDRRKGVDIIQAALKKLPAENVTLMPTAIASMTPEFEAVFSQFESLPPRHLSTDAELNLYYNAADIVWHPTRADTSSMVSLEAFACRTPVIAAAVGGVPEIVRDGETGLLIPPNDPDALVAATTRLLNDAALRERLGRQARDMVEREFSVNRFAEDHLNLYRRVLDGDASPAPTAH